MAELPCPMCGSTLTFLEQYKRYYCHRCGQYAPEGYGDQGVQHCPTCGGILSFIAQYGRFYCYHCSVYPPEPSAAASKEVATAAASPAVAPATVPSTAPAEASPTAAATTPGTTTAPTTVATAEVPVSPVSTSTEPLRKPEVPSLEATPALQPSPVPETAAPAVEASPVESDATEPSPEIQTLAASKPAVVRVKIFALKKSELIDLCKAYSLDPSGTKEQLQERLLSYLHDLEAEEQPAEEERTEEPAAQPSPAMAEEMPLASVEPRARDADTSGDAAEPAAASQSVLQVEETRPTSTSESAPAPVPVVIVAPSAEPAPSVEPARAPLKAEHPCPTCGRELTYISQYGRYYCYYCQRYAPAAARSKNACPTCGATMRWIGQHQRWWCDACQRYAPADLPPPGTSAAAARPVAAAAAARTAVPRTVTSHRHSSPAMGIGLVGLGLTLFILYEFFAVFAPAMNLGVNNPFPGNLGSVMTFFSFLFVAAGAMIGLSSLRDRP